MAFLGQQDLISACVSLSPSHIILVKAFETRRGLLVYTLGFLAVRKLAAIAMHPT
jgi:hypothetical protein